MKGMQDWAALVARLTFGGLLALTHGWGKFQGVLAGRDTFADPLGLGPQASLVLAALGEFVFAILVALGVKTRWTVWPPLITLAVATFVHHAGDPLERREKAILYLAGLVIVWLLGSGRFSVDRWWKKGRRS